MKTLLLFILSIFSYSFICTVSAIDWNIYVAKYKQGKVCAVSYTFDDGLAEHSTVAAPELEKRGFRGTFWICGYYTEQGASAKVPRMTWDELKEMAKKGHEISSHGWAHKNAKRLTLEQVKAEIEKNDSAILANTGTKPVTYCYPYNYKTEEIVRLASQNRVGTRTKQLSLGSKSTPQRFDKWLNDLMKKEEWGVGMTHGIHSGYDAFKDPVLFWNHLDKVKSMEDKIWVGTFREVASYIREREDIQLKVSCNKRRLTITPRMTLNENLFTEPLTMVIEGKEVVTGGKEVKIKGKEVKSVRKEVKEVSVKQGKKQLAARIADGKVIFDFNPYAGKIKVSIRTNR